MMLKYSSLGHVLTAPTLFFACWITSAACTATAALQADRLRCEVLIDPTGIGAKSPALDWIVTSAQRNQSQSAYRILVASTLESLGEENGDLWDSGRVASGKTSGIDYEGTPIAAHQRCYWKVRVWDQDAEASPWSDVAEWSVGPLAPADWQAAWIGYDAAAATAIPKADFGAGVWVWRSGVDPRTADPESVVFTREWELPTAAIESASLTIAADSDCTFVVNGHEVANPIFADRPLQVDLRPYLKPGSNRLRARVKHASKGPAGLIARLQAKLEDGSEQECSTDASWLAAVAVEEDWKAQVFPDAPEGNAVVVGPAGCDPWGELTLPYLTSAPASYLRKSVQIKAPPRRATISIASLGWADVSLNGELVNRDFFTSGWTDYAKRVYSRTYDVTDLLKKGDNAWSAVLSSGWYSGHIGWRGDRDHYGKRPRLMASLRVEYPDGSVETFGTNESWHAALGPVTAADILVGEEYDARRELPGWDKPGYDATEWQSVDAGAEVAPIVQSHPGPPVVAVEEFTATAISEPSPGVYVVDFGQNFAGVFRLRIAGKPGQKIELRFAERLNADGTAYTTNMRYARATDVYTCRGDGIETWTPRHTFHGFQYAEIRGLETAPTAETLVGIALTSDTPVAGTFSCSDSMLNKLHSNIEWTQRANFIDVPTDCPQRDERLGWTGDAQVYINAACLNADTQAFFRKWLVDLTDAQRADGQFPMVAPLKVAEGDGGPAWADAGVVCPWSIYQFYDDERLLREQYDSMKRFVRFCRNRSRDGVLPPEKYHCFGDWLSIDADTPKDVIYTAYLARSTDLLAKAAAVLGEEDDAKKYRAQFEEVKAAFQKEFVSPAGEVRGDTQCGYALAIRCDLLDEEQERMAGERLANDIKAKGGRLSTGFIGTADLLFALSEVGRSDLAYDLLHSEKFPGWGFSIKHGATSIWERWDGWTADKGFQTAGMNSFAHYSFGAVYHWMVENIGGIRRDLPGYCAFTIAPDFASPLQHAETTYESINGKIVSRWKRVDGGLQLSVTVPANTSATVRLPAAQLNHITESGSTLDTAAGIKSVAHKSGIVVISIGSGDYDFAVVPE